MADQDVELIGRMYEAWNGGDVAALTALFDTEVEVRPGPLSTFMSSTVYRGRAGVAAWFADTYEPWADLRAEPERYLPAGDRILVVVGLHARVSGGEVELETEIAHVVTVRDGRILRLDGYDSPEAALESVGLAA